MLLAAESSAFQPAWLPMTVLGVIMLVTYLFIAFEKLHKSVSAIVGAIAAVIAAMSFGLFSHHGYHEVHEIIGHDLNILGVIIGTSILVDTVGGSGLFHFIGIRVVKLTGGAPKLLFLFVCLLTFLFVSLLTLAPGSLLMASLVLVICRTLGYHPKPYLIAVAIVANSAALTTFSSGIATLMVGTAAQIPYAHFFVGSTPLAFATGGVAIVLLIKLYGKRLLADAAQAGDPADLKAKVAGFDEWALVKDRKVFWRSAVVLGLTVVGFATAQLIGVGLDFIAMAGGMAALLFCAGDPEQAIKKVKWSVILFFVGLFVIIGAVKATGLLELTADTLVGLGGGSAVVLVLIIGVFVMVTSGFVDNIPIAATMIPILDQIALGSPEIAAPLFWVLIASANLGGNSTPIGSVSSVIALHALESDRGEKVGWGEYMKAGGIILAVQAVLVLGYVLVMMQLGWFADLPKYVKG
ncbi:MAG: transporter [Planctomycetes bacterium]|nr:transporter [Planctomycetota bacterium]